MKVSRPVSHSSDVGVLPKALDVPLAAREQPLELTALYDRYFHEVECWLRAMGAPELAEAVSVVGQLTVAELLGVKMVTPGAVALASTAVTATADAPALSTAVAVTM